MTPDQISYWNLRELERSNKMREFQNQQSLNENKRHNVVSEQEINRHNLMSENLTYQSQLETARHNLVSENQNQQMLNETIRTHLANEEIGRQQVSLGYAQLAETKRNNIASLAEQERYHKDSIANQSWYNVNLIANQQNTLNETKRHNQRVENLTQVSNTLGTFSPVVGGFLNSIKGGF